ncbi:mucoidy inhibitor MuiA family protein [uncultured Cardiobacterium sp.]|uniref:mucoidy inhibitor MuiA family protein n=1 Tax=uncultured Cardiobacterium sp. TaxID=417619 RepID=UPI00262E4F31|nr:mucoidy inhibitor MuiA family protein [uncultured Cardiobacterium sp.]
MRLWIAAWLAAAAISVAHTEDYELDAPVVTARLYSNEAELVREARATVKHGTHRLIVSPLLSDNIADVSLSIEGARLTGQGMRPLPAPDTSDPLLQQADAAEQALTITRQTIEDNRDMSRALIQRLQNQNSTVDNVQRQLDALARVREKLLKTEREQQDELKKLQEQLAWQNKGRDSRQYAGIFDIYSDHSGEVTLTLREHTKRAYWQPYSEFSLNSDTGTLDIRAYAQVVQQSGLDWQNSNIALSFAPPDYREQPALQSATVAIADRTITALVGENAPFSANTALLKGTVSATAATKAGQNDKTADVSISGVDFAVNIPGKHNLASSRDRYQLTYWQNRSHAKLYSAAYAWIASKALLIAEWQQPDGHGFYPGNASFFRDGNRIGNQRLDRPMNANSRQIMSFGEDPHIDVAYSVPPGHVGNGLILRDRLERRQTVTLSNHGKTARNVRLYARLPLATQPDVRVEAKFAPKPDAENVDNVKGIVLWEKNLAHGDSLRVENGYDIHYPEGKKLIGIE